IGPLRQVAAETTRVPRRMASDATHVVIGMGTSLFAASGQIAPYHLVAFEADGLGQGGLFVEAGIPRRNRVAGLHDFPAQSFFDHGILEDADTAAAEVLHLEAR